MRLTPCMLRVAGVLCAMGLGILPAGCSKPVTSDSEPVTAAPTTNWVRYLSSTPRSPASLTSGAQMTVRFAYSLTNQGGALIMVEPYANGRRLPDYSGHGSPKYEAGTGEGFGHFGALKVPAELREVRIEMKEFGTARLLASTNVSIEAHWE